MGAADITPPYAQSHANAGIVVCRITDLEKCFFDGSSTGQVASSVELLYWLHNFHATVDTVITEFDGFWKFGNYCDTFCIAANILSEMEGQHLDVLVAMALKLRDATALIKLPNGSRVKLALSVHSGEVVTGVVGNTRLEYEVVGGVVQMARFMNQHVAPGQIMISEAAFALLTDQEDWRYAGDLHFLHVTIPTFVFGDGCAATDFKSLDPGVTVVTSKAPVGGDVVDSATTESVSGQSDVCQSRGDIDKEMGKSDVCQSRGDIVKEMACPQLGNDSAFVVDPPSCRVLDSEFDSVSGQNAGPAVLAERQPIKSVPGSCCSSEASVKSGVSSNPSVKSGVSSTPSQHPFWLYFTDASVEGTFKSWKSEQLFVVDILILTIRALLLLCKWRHCQSLGARVPFTLYFMSLLPLAAALGHRRWYWKLRDLLIVLHALTASVAGLLNVVPLCLASSSQGNAWLFRCSGIEILVAQAMLQLPFATLIALQFATVGLVCSFPSLVSMKVAHAVELCGSVTCTLGQITAAVVVPALVSMYLERKHRQLFLLKTGPLNHPSMTA